jgi:hypothetical protein
MVGDAHPTCYDYLVRWLLSFVDQVTVISPPGLEEIIADFVRQLADHYTPRLYRKNGPK